jgi:hypothetical protein
MASHDIPPLLDEEVRRDLALLSVLGRSTEGIHPRTSCQSELKRLSPMDYAATHPLLAEYFGRLEYGTTDRAYNLKHANIIEDCFSDINSFPRSRLLRLLSKVVGYIRVSYQRSAAYFEVAGRLVTKAGQPQFLEPYKEHVLDFPPSLFPRAYMRHNQRDGDLAYGVACLHRLCSDSFTAVMEHVPGVDIPGTWIRDDKLYSPYRFCPLRADTSPAVERRSFLGYIDLHKPVLLRRNEVLDDLMGSDDPSNLLLHLGHDAWITGYALRWFGNIASEALTNIRAEWNVTIAMGSHRRLGAASPLYALDPAVLVMIADLILVNEYELF